METARDFLIYAIIAAFAISAFVYFWQEMEAKYKRRKARKAGAKISHDHKVKGYTFLNGQRPDFPVTTEEFCADESYFGDAA